MSVGKWVGEYPLSSAGPSANAGTHVLLVVTNADIWLPVAPNPCLPGPGTVSPWYTESKGAE